jgi:hypothetical protein
LVTSVPEAGWHVPRRSAFAALAQNTLDTTSTSAERFFSRNHQVLNAFATLPMSPNLHILHPHELLCETDLPDRCITTRQGIPLYADADHLTNSASALLVDALFPWVLLPR